MTAEAPGAHRAPARSPVTALFVATGLAWARERVRSALAAEAPAGRVLCWLLRTGWGAASGVFTLAVATALSVLLARPDRPAAPRHDPVRMVEHADVMPCRTSTGGRCDVLEDVVYVPVGGGRG